MVVVVIDDFSGVFAFLSNFYIEPDSTHVEGEYQAGKCQNAADRNLFIGLSPARAKRIGRTVSLRPDWDAVKIPLMHSLVLRKFIDHPELRAALVATSNEELVEGNWWGDTFWGVCRGVGDNNLGLILMDVRRQLR